MTNIPEDPASYNEIEEKLAIDAWGECENRAPHLGLDPEPMEKTPPRGNVPSKQIPWWKTEKILTKAEEADLFERYRQGDKKAGDRIVTAHVHLCKPYFKQFAPLLRDSSFQESDIINAGTIGLMAALKRFKPERGNRFSTYAMWWVRKAIYDHLKTARPLDDAQQHSKVSLDAPAFKDGEETTVGALIDAVRANPRGTHHQLEEAYRALELAIDSLSERERRIYVARNLTDNPPPLRELANELKISGERVRKIEMRAARKVGFAARQAIGANDRKSRARKMMREVFGRNYIRTGPPDPDLFGPGGGGPRHRRIIQSQIPERWKFIVAAEQARRDRYRMLQRVARESGSLRMAA